MLNNLQENNLEKICELTHINLSSCENLTYRTLNEIVRKCKKLVCLVVKNNPKMLEFFSAVKELKKLKNLEIFNIANCDITDGQLFSIMDKLTALKKFNLHGIK